MSPSGEGLGGEPGEDDVVEGADADAGEHGGDGERGHRPGDRGGGGDHGYLATQSPIEVQNKAMLHTVIAIINHRLNRLRY